MQKYHIVSKRQNKSNNLSSVLSFLNVFFNPSMLFLLKRNYIVGLSVRYYHSVHIIMYGNSFGSLVHVKSVHLAIERNKLRNDSIGIATCRRRIGRFYIAHGQAYAKVGNTAAFGKEYLLPHEIDKLKQAVVAIGSVYHSRIDRCA